MVQNHKCRRNQYVSLSACTHLLRALSRLLLRLGGVCGLEPVDVRRGVAVLGAPAPDLKGPLTHGVKERPE